MFVVASVAKEEEAMVISGGTIALEIFDEEIMRADCKAGDGTNDIAEPRRARQMKRNVLWLRAMVRSIVVG